MNALAILNNYLPEEVVEIQEKTMAMIVQSVEDDGGIPTYRDIANALGHPVLVVTKMIEQHPDLYELMQLAKTAVASEIESRVAKLAQGELGRMIPAGVGSEKYWSGVDPTELAAAKMLLEANHPSYAKKPTSVTVINPRVPVGSEGRDAAITAVEELSRRFNQM